MNIQDNFFMLLDQIKAIIYSPLNRLLILASTSQIASMFAKMIISSVRAKSLSFRSMATYGGMPSSHTVFMTSLIFGAALDPKLGWGHPIFTLSLVFSMITIVDIIRFRGTVDRINKALEAVIDKIPELRSEGIKLPKHIAHTGSEVIGGLVFAFLYTFLFYLFFYGIFR